jgi:hypothetical protein
MEILEACDVTGSERGAAELLRIALDRSARLNV